MPRKSKEEFSLEKLSDLGKEKVSEKEEKELEKREKQREVYEERRERRKWLAEEKEKISKTEKARLEKARAELEETGEIKLSEEDIEPVTEEELEVEKSRKKKMTAKEKTQEKEFESILQERVDEFREKSGLPKVEEEEFEHILDTVVNQYQSEDRVQKGVRDFYDSQVRTTLEATPTAFKELFPKNIRKNINTAEYGRTEDARERAQEVVDEEIESIIRQYETSLDLINGTDKRRENAAQELQEEFNFNIEKKGLFSGIGRFFKELAVKSKLDKNEKVEFNLAKKIYKTNTKAYKHWIKRHSKRFGKLEESVESGIGATRHAIGTIGAAFSVKGGSSMGVGLKGR